MPIGIKLPAIGLAQADQIERQHLFEGRTIAYAH